MIKHPKFICRSIATYGESNPQQNYFINPLKLSIKLRNKTLTKKQYQHIENLTLSNTYIDRRFNGHKKVGHKTRQHDGNLLYKHGDLKGL